MKRNLIILCTTIATLSLAFYGFTNWKPNNDKVISLENKGIAINQNVKSVTPDLYYGVDTRFAAVKKADIHNATTIYDFLNEGEKSQIEQINSVRITIVKDNQLSHIEAYGVNEQLTDAQLGILKSTDYFNHFTVRTEFKGKNKNTGKLEERFFGPHITVTPDKQAVYIDGKESLINYLMANSKESMSIIKGDNLGALKISFIVTKEGKVDNVKHDAMTTGYPSIDEKFMELIKNIPGKWTPAENSNGEKMDYEFVFTFGPRDGC
jgi:hypothetical protein